MVRVAGPLADDASTRASAATATALGTGVWRFSSFGGPGYFASPTLSPLCPHRALRMSRVGIAANATAITIATIASRAGRFHRLGLACLAAALAGATFLGCHPSARCRFAASARARAPARMAGIAAARGGRSSSASLIAARSLIARRWLARRSRLALLSDPVIAASACSWAARCRDSCTLSFSSRIAAVHGCFHRRPPARRAVLQAGGLKRGDRGGAVLKLLGRLGRGPMSFGLSRLSCRSLARRRPSHQVAAQTMSPQMAPAAAATAIATAGAIPPAFAVGLAPLATASATRRRLVKSVNGASPWPRAIVPRARCGLALPQRWRSTTPASFLGEGGAELAIAPRRARSIQCG